MDEINLYMNDFTKEELELLKYCALRCKLYDKQSQDLFNDLDQSLIKIQSMIDNYCEHDFGYKDIGRVEICGKCEKIKEIK